MSKRLGVFPASTGTPTAGIARVILPSDVERDNYVTQCLRTGRVSIATEFGEFFNDVAISLEALNHLTFPINHEKFGSQVVWLRTTGHQKPVIVGILINTDESPALGEDVFSLLRESANGLVNILGDGKTGVITVEAAGKSSGTGGVILRVSNPQNDALLRLIICGDVDVQVRRKIKIKTNRHWSLVVGDATAANNIDTELGYVYNEGLTYIDEWGNKITTREEQIQIENSEGVSILLTPELLRIKLGETENRTIEVNEQGISLGTAGGSADPAVLGNKLKEWLENVLRSIQTLTVPTALGPSGVPINAAEFASAAQRLDTILSEHNTLD